MGKSSKTNDSRREKERKMKKEGEKGNDISNRRCSIFKVFLKEPILLDIYVYLFAPWFLSDMQKYSRKLSPRGRRMQHLR